MHIQDGDLSTRNYTPQERHDFDNTDGSSSLFSKYLKMSDAEDEKMASNWRADTDRILIFVSANIAHELQVITMAQRNIEWSILGCCRKLIIHNSGRSSTRSLGNSSS